MNFIPPILKRILSVVVLFALTFVVIAFATGALRAKGPETTASPISSTVPTTEAKPTTEPVITSSEDPATTEPPVTSSVSEKPEYYSNLSHVLGYKGIDGLTVSRTSVSLSERIENHNRLCGQFETLENNPDVSVQTSSDFNPETDRIVKGGVIADKYSSGNKIVLKYHRIENNSDASYKTVSTKVTVERPTVEPYMGFLIISSDNGNKRTLCDSFGNVLFDDLGELEPYFGRDMKNNPVFSKTEDGEEHYYIFSSEKSSFTEIDGKTIRTGLRYDYPVYAYAPCGYEVKWDDASESYRYYYESRKQYRFQYYYYGFNYSEDRTVMVLPDGVEVAFVDRSGYRCFRQTKKYNHETGVPGQDMWVIDYYTLPDTLGIESIGTAGYDHGWVRVRIQAKSQMPHTKGKIATDIDSLIDYKGNKFDIPEGFTLEGYSDGVLLLSKNGYYGFYSINHEWIARPIYTYAMPFVQGLAVIGYEDGTVGMIDTAGNIVMPFVFTSLSLPSSGVITAFCEGIGWETYYIVSSESDQ